MKLISPFTILRDALKIKAPEGQTCFIDEVEVAMNECGVPIEAEVEIPKINFWDEECERHPTNSHCKVYDY